MGDECRNFWQDEFVTPAQHVRLRLKTLGEVVDGDAPVETPKEAAAPRFEPVREVTSPKRSPPPRRQAPALRPKRGAEAVDGEYKYDRNNRRKRLCRGFQRGRCGHSQRGSVTCPDDPELRHQCANCLSWDHGAEDCPVRPDREDRRDDRDADRGRDRGDRRGGGGDRKRRGGDRGRGGGRGGGRQRGRGNRG